MEADQLLFLVFYKLSYCVLNDPGRLNQVSVYLNRQGTFFGQCSEICGILHSSMPIVIQSVSLQKFLLWLRYNLEN